MGETGTSPTTSEQSPSKAKKPPRLRERWEAFKQEFFPPGRRDEPKLDAPTPPTADKPKLDVLAPQTPEDRHYLELMFQEHAEHARQLETLRATAMGFFIALIAGLLAFGVTEVHNTRVRTWVSGVLVCLVSLLGWILNYKHYERYRRHTEIRRGYRRALEAGIKTAALAEIQADRRKAHKTRFPFTSDALGLQGIWSWIYVVTFVAGAIEFIAGISGGSANPQ